MTFHGLSHGHALARRGRDARRDRSPARAHRLTIAAAAVMIVLPLSVEAGELRITVGGIRSAHDTVLIGLYGSPASRHLFL